MFCYSQKGRFKAVAPACIAVTTSLQNAVDEEVIFSYSRIFRPFVPSFVLSRDDESNLSLKEWLTDLADYRCVINKLIYAV